MTRPDPQPSDWLLRSRYGAERVLTTRAKRRPFTVRYDSGSLAVTTLAGTSVHIDQADLAKGWSMLAADPVIRASVLGLSGSYVQAVYDDLHRPVDDDDPDGSYSVYVIELDEASWDDKAMQARNPQPDISKPCVYVGYTGESVWTRFQKHLTGKRFSKRVRRFGLRPLPELYSAVNPLADKPTALQVEASLTDALRTAGFRVWEGELGDLHLDRL